MKAQAVVNLNFSSEKQMRVVLQALKPETESTSMNRSKLFLTTEGRSLVLDFRAKDTSALRAAINSYLRLIGVAMSLQKLSE